MRERLTILCFLAALCAAGPARAASEALWLACARTGDDRDRLVAACGRIAGDKRAAAHDRAVAYNNRGDAFLEIKDFPRAVADFGAALRLDPGLVPTWRKRALAYREHGDFDRALADADAALRLAPGDAATLRLRGDTFFARSKVASKARTGDIDAAIADYAELIRADPRDADAYRRRGLAFEAKGDRDAAALDYFKFGELVAK